MAQNTDDQAYWIVDGDPHAHANSAIEHIRRLRLARHTEVGLETPAGVTVLAPDAIERLLAA